MTIRRLENSDTGTYSCVATNDAGQVDANLRLSVLVGPVIRQFESVVVDELKDASIRCFVIEAYPPPTFRWKFADTQEFIDINSNSNEAISIINTDMQSEIIFKSVRKQYKRNYTCVASNKAATSEYTAGLLVKCKYSLLFAVEGRSKIKSFMDFSVFLKFNYVNFHEISLIFVNYRNFV